MGGLPLHCGTNGMFYLKMAFRLANRRMHTNVCHFLNDSKSQLELERNNTRTNLIFVFELRNL